MIDKDEVMKHYRANTETAGGTRYNAGKPQYHSLPLLGLEEVAKVGTQGAEKYGHFNWWRGQSFSTLVNSAMRHTIKAAWDPNNRDRESGNYHAAHAVWNWLAILHFLAEGRTELNDIFKEREPLVRMIDMDDEWLIMKGDKALDVEPHEVPPRETSRSLGDMTAKGRVR